MDKLKITNLEVSCIIGLLDRERLEKQPLVLSLCMETDLESAAASCDLNKSINYATLSGELKFILEHGQFTLIETAAQAIAHYVLNLTLGDGERPVKRVEVVLEKPHALQGEGVPSIQISRDQRVLAPESLSTVIGQVEIIHSTPDCTIYQLQIPPESATPLFLQRQGRVAEMALDEGLFLDHIPLTIGMARNWPANFVRRYINPDRKARRILAVSKYGLAGLRNVMSSKLQWEFRDLPKDALIPYYSPLIRGIGIKSDRGEYIQGLTRSVDSNHCN